MNISPSISSINSTLAAEKEPALPKKIDIRERVAHIARAILEWFGTIITSMKSTLIAWSKEASLLKRETEKSPLPISSANNHTVSTEDVKINESQQQKEKSSDFSKEPLVLEKVSEQVKEETKIHLGATNLLVEAPRGLPNNLGNSCWFITAIQMLLSCPSLEELLDTPLQREEISSLTGDIESEKSEESDQELASRNKIKYAFQQLVSVIKNRNSHNEEIRKSLVALHQTILDNKNDHPALRSIGFPKIDNSGDDPKILLDLLNVVLGKRLFTPCHGKLFFDTIATKTASDGQMMLDATTLLKKNEPPRYILTYNLDCDIAVDYNEEVDISEYRKDGSSVRYRIIASSHHDRDGVHMMAYVRRENGWYHCDNRSVEFLGASLNKDSAKNTENLLMERIDE